MPDDREPFALLVIGGGPAGLAATRAYRAHSGRGRVLLVSQDAHLPYNRPPLSKDFLRGTSDEQSLPLVPDEWYTDQQIETLIGTEVVELDPDGSARTADGTDLRFDKAVLATGSAPVRPPIPGAEHALLLRSRTDAARLRSAAARAGSAVVLGSGFIGCEAAVSLALRGLDVELITPERIPHEKRLGADAGERIASWLQEAGVRVRCGTAVQELPGPGSVVLDDGSTVRADLVLAATGVRPLGDLARTAGLAMVDDRVAVDDQMRTSSDLVTAVGDVAFAANATAGRHLAVEHWGEAERMGEIAGTVLAGGRARWDEVPGFWSSLGENTLKYAAWGDGWDDASLVDHGDGAFTVWYGKGGRCVGVLTHKADDDLTRGKALIADGAAVSDA